MLTLYCFVVLCILSESMLEHVRIMGAKLKLSDQQLNLTIREYQITAQDLETTVQR